MKLRELKVKFYCKAEKCVCGKPLCIDGSAPEDEIVCPNLVVEAVEPKWLFKR